MSTETPSPRPPTGRVWLITGTSSGFGRTIAEAALSAGDTVVATARRPQTLQDLAAAHPDRVCLLELDVTDAARITAVVTQVILRYGRIDVLVNNAGRALVGAVEATTDRQLRHLMDLHFFGPAALTREVLPHMRRRGSGSIVQLSSMGGRMSFAGVAAYSATKFALEGLSEALAAEVAPFGIKVLIVEPGAFRTNLNAAGAMLRAPAIDAYADSVGAVAANLDAADGRQPGDPAKAATAILAALDADATPLRLVLGNDAADAISASLEQARAEFLAWEPTARSVHFADAR
ncbi:oxidoreductase [Micromonospora sp. NPDC085948]|uniref:oxidoreductase n=1 Tax=Micromonospora sp. NPDC085948 TaxID=3155293 RepID=UPI0034137A15